MLVFALILLFFANHQRPSVLFRHGVASRRPPSGELPAGLPLGMFMALFVVYGFDTAGTFGEETVDASRQAPRGVLSSIWISGHRRRRLPARRHPRRSRASREPSPRARPAASRSPRRSPANLHGRLFGGHHVRRALPVRHPRLGLRVHPGHPGRGDPADVLDGPRPATCRSGNLWGHVNPTFKTPANAADRGRRPRRRADPRDRSARRLLRSRSRRPGLIYLSYFLCNLGVLWPRAAAAGRTSGAWFSLGSWGMLDQRPRPDLRRLR